MSESEQALTSPGPGAVAAARRIEVMLAGSFARYAGAACELDRTGQARCLELGAVLDDRGSRAVAFWARPGTPRSRVLGLGLDGPVRSAELDAVEAFYAPLGRSWYVDCSPASDASLADGLRKR